MAKTRKALNFDLNVSNLKKFYPKQHYNQAYSEIRGFLEKAGFEHRQGSGYVSKDAITNADVLAIAEKMGMKMEWLKYCVKEFDVTSVGKTHSLLSNFQKDTAFEKEEPFTDKQDVIDKDFDITDEFDLDMEM